jgi:GntR family galactonate operon transcriptional repressor
MPARAPHSQSADYSTLALSAQLASADHALRLFPNKLYSQKTLHGRIAHTIGLWIVRSDLLEGQTLPSEAELCEMFEASRTAIREALRVLSAKNLIESRQKSGSQVRPRQYWNLMDPDVLHWHRLASPQGAFPKNLMELRQILEPAAAELAATRATGADHARIETACDHMARTADGDRMGFLKADLEFHYAVLQAAHNEALIELAHPLGTALLAAFESSVDRTPDAPRIALPLHEAVFDAIVRRAGKRAHAAMAVCVRGDVIEASAQPAESERPRQRGGRKGKR